MFSPTGLSYCVHIEQPSHAVVKQADTVKIPCSHDDSSLDVMLWYRRSRGSTALVLIGYNYASASPNHEPEFQNNFQHNRLNTLKGDLTISNLNISDSAVYYCAVRSHSGVVLSLTWLKTQAREMNSSVQFRVEAYYSYSLNQGCE